MVSRFCEDIGADIEALPKLLEPGRTQVRVAQDEDAPPLADPFQGAGDRASLGFEALAAQESVAYNYHDDTNRIVTFIMRVNIWPDSRRPCRQGSFPRPPIDAGPPRPSRCETSREAIPCPNQSL